MPASTASLRDISRLGHFVRNGDAAHGVQLRLDRSRCRCFVSKLICLGQLLGMASIAARSLANWSGGKTRKHIPA